MPRILITGGLGFIGSHLARAMVGVGKYDVVLCDYVINEGLIKDIRDRVEVVRCDVSNPYDVYEIFKKYRPDAVVHLAALLSADAETNPHIGFRVNFEGSWNVYEAARIFDTKTIVYPSSIAAYGAGLEGKEVVNEEIYTLPKTLYGVSKQFNEMLGMWYYWRYGVNFIALRLASVIGPGRKDGGASAYTTLIIQKAAQGEPYEIPVEEDVRIPIVYIKDVTDLIIHILENPSKAKSRIYNVQGPYPSPTARELADSVKSIVPSAQLMFKPNPTITNIVKTWPRDLSMDRIKNELGWAPKYGDLKALIQDFINEVRKHLDIFTI
jgi:UDP-glucose 4-epimerase